MWRLRVLLYSLSLLISVVGIDTTVLGQGVVIGSFDAGGWSGNDFVYDWLPLSPTTSAALTAITSQDFACADGDCSSAPAFYVICSVNAGTYNECPSGSLLAISDPEVGYAQCNGSCPFAPLTFTFSGTNQITLQTGLTYFVRPYICTYGPYFCGGGHALAGGLQTFAGMPPQTVSFPNQTDNVTSPPIPIAFRNSGGSSVTISSVPVISGENAADFLVAAGSTCTPGATVAPEASCLVNVTFTPSFMVPESATLSTAGWEGGTTQSVELTGTGEAPTTSPQSPRSRPILFVPGICEESDDWWALRSSISADLNHDLPTLFPDEKNYDVYSGSSVVFESNSSAVDESTIPLTARFFTVKFVNPAGNDNDPSGAAQVSILNKANELSSVIQEITRITNSKDLILVAHSMGGLVARTYLENLASTSPCYNYTVDSQGIYTNGSPDYANGCQPGEAKYSDNVALLVTLDTPHGGSELAQIALTSPVDVFADLLPCLGPSSTARTEMLPNSELLSTLNYFASSAGEPSAIPGKISINSVESFLSDINPAWEMNPLILDNPTFALTENDGAISSGNQSMEASVAPAAKNASQFGDSENPYTLETISGQSVCQLSGFTLLHLITCLGQQPGTDSLVYSKIEPFAKETVAIGASVESPIYGYEGSFSAIVTIKNTGTVALDSVQLSMNQTTLGSIPESIPVSIGNLEPNAGTTITLVFPMSPTLSTAANAPLKIQGTYSAGTVSGNWSITFRSVPLSYLISEL